MKSATRSSFDAPNAAYENLANAVIEQAVKDYVTSASALYHELTKPWRLQSPTRVHTRLYEILSIDRFFHSDLYALYTQLPASMVYKAIYQRLDRLIKPDGTRYIRRQIEEYSAHPNTYMKRHHTLAC